jgi:hypothetical protein
MELDYVKNLLRDLRLSNAQKPATTRDNCMKPLGNVCTVPERQGYFGNYALMQVPFYYKDEPIFPFEHKRLMDIHFGTQKPLIFDEGSPDADKRVNLPAEQKSETLQNRAEKNKKRRGKED